MNKTYYQKHKKERKKYSRQYYQKNKERILKYQREFHRRNKRKKHQYQKEYFQTKKGKYLWYKRIAKKRNISWQLTYKDFLTFWQKPCYYCRDKIKTIGLDRIDNSRGYKMGNVVSCCWKCNQMKSELSGKDFIKHCQKIANNF